MTRLRLLLVLAVAAVAAVALPGTGRAGGECTGVPDCISVPGPWVAVPAHGEANYLLECPGRSGIVGGLDAPVTSQKVEVTFDGLIASPVVSGHTTTTFAFFRAVSANGRPGAFQPRIGCIPQKAQAVDTAWRPDLRTRRFAASARVVPLGAPLDLRAAKLVLRPGKVQAAAIGCPTGEHLVSGWDATVFDTADPPDLSLAGLVHVRRTSANGKVKVTVETSRALPAAAKASVQVGAACAGP